MGYNASTMELPENIKTLYRHWEFHVEKGLPLQADEPTFNTSLFRDICFFIDKRMSIWQKKVSHQPEPYTTDPILAKYRFCNILREVDKQTIVFHTLLNPLREDFPLWLLNMFYCRMVARPETIESAGWLSFDAAQNKEVFDRLMFLPRPRFGTPYVFPISVIQKSPTPTRELFITEYLPSVMKMVAAKIPTWKKRSVYDGLQRVIPLFGKNLYFLWTEVLIDTAYQFPEYIDLFSRFPIGPGAMPTLKKLDPKRDPSLLVRDLCSLPVDLGITYNGRQIRLSAENWEGIACEFRKYTNLKSGKGRKRLYR